VLKSFISFDKHQNQNSNSTMTVESYATSVKSETHGRKDKNGGRYKNNRNQCDHGRKGDSNNHREEKYCKIHGNCYHSSEECRILQREENEDEYSVDSESGIGEKRKRENCDGSSNINAKFLKRDSISDDEDSEEDDEVNDTEISTSNSEVLYRKNKAGKFEVAVNAASVSSRGISIYNDGERVASRGGVNAWCNMTVVSAFSVDKEEKPVSCAENNVRDTYHYSMSNYLSHSISSTDTIDQPRDMDADSSVSNIRL
jgi:hypothetical protein